MKSNSILFLIPSMRGGGAEKVTLLLANELVRRKWDVALVMSKLEGPFLERLDNRIRILELPYKKISHNLFKIRKILQEENPSIFYTSMSHVNVIGGIAHKISNTTSKIVISEHSNIIEVLNSSGKFLNLILSYSVKLTYKDSAQIVCVSAGVETAIKSLIPNLRNTTVIFNPIEQLKPKIFTEYHNSPYNILSMGRLRKVKNYLMLLRAFKYLIDQDINATLTIIGEGDERKNLEHYIDINNLQDRVFLPGFQNPNEYLKRSDVFVMSSEWEGFGNVIVEALSTGIPVISTDCPSGPAEILSYGEYGRLVPNNDFQAMAKAIYEEYKSSPNIDKRRKRIERAQDFTPAKIASEYEDLFNSILQTK